MSEIALSEAKEFLRVIHNHDDAMIQRLLDGAEDQALQYMDREDFGDLCPDDSDYVSSSDYPMPPSVETAVLLLLQADYGAMPEEAERLRNSARSMLWPFRCRLGV